MPTFGHVSEFVVEDKRISAYLKWVEFYFGANDIALKKKWLSFCMSVIGPKTYAMLWSLVAPAQPKDKPFAELETLLKALYDP